MGERSSIYLLQFKVVESKVDDLYHTHTMAEPKVNEKSKRAESSVSMYDVMKDMEVIHKYMHRGGGTKKQTILTSFVSVPNPPVPVSDSSRSRTTHLQVNPPESKRPRTDSNIETKYQLRHKTTQSNHERSDSKRPANSASVKKTSIKRTCPFYKRVPGTEFTVDAFRYGSIPGCNGYFLSHFHSDHYQGLNRRFEGTLYCSKVTANLVIKQLKVTAACVHSLTLNKPHIIEGVEVTLLEANHCPGAVLLLFQLSSGRTYLHTGDFRFCSSMLSYPQLSGKTIHELYLDTTYCHPKHDFPKQIEAISFAVETSLQAIMKNPKTLIICGTYTIGKEKVFQAIAEALACDVCVTTEKKDILNCLDSDWISQHVHTDPHSSQLHVIPIGKLNINYLSSYLEQFSDKYTAALAFKPTGWTYSGSLSSVRPRICGPISIYGIPYSEHSSYSELREFVQHLRPLKVIPTVNNSSAKQRDEMQEYFKEWKGQLKPVSTSKQTTLFESFKTT